MQDNNDLDKDLNRYEPKDLTESIPNPDEALDISPYYESRCERKRKKTRKIYWGPNQILWIIAAIGLQLGIYLYLDKVTFAPAASFSQQALENGPISGLSTRYSYNNAYYAQVSEQAVKVFQTSNDKLKREINLEKSETVSYFSWLPENNLALVGITRNDNKTSSVILKPINLETTNQPVEPQIDSLAKGAKIVSVACSVETNVVYLLINSGNNLLVYKTDANNKIKKINTGTYHIQRIACLKSQDFLIYDCIDRKKVYQVDGNGNKTIVCPDKYQYALIGVDNQDNIYLGRLGDRNLVSTILVGKINGTFTEYKKLDSPYPVESIKITINGELQII